MVQLRSEPEGILDSLVSKAVRQGADTLEIEYKDGREEICAMRGDIGYSIASIESSSDDAATLREQVSGIGKKGKIIAVHGASYRLTVKTYESFGETAFRVRIERSPGVWQG
jgi:hypothetical protein